jgi:hypothetical protein
VYARSTTFLARVSSIDEGITHIRDEVLPALTAIDGCIGLSLLVDRNSGRCIATSAWQSEDAMRSSENQVEPIRDSAAAIFGGSPQVERWEIAVLHRDHRSRDGACVRATWMQVEPAQADRGIDMFKMATLPAIEDLEGFCSASLMVDRASGRSVSSVTYDTMESMERNREAAGAVRRAGIEEADAQVLEVGEFELALAHLRVPEMA